MDVRGVEREQKWGEEQDAIWAIVQESRYEVEDACGLKRFSLLLWGWRIS